MQTLKTDIRKRILTVSKRLFLKKGFRETTTRDIAREAGINLSNLYHYFASKDELFRELLKPATDTLESMLNEHHGIKGEDILRMQEEGYAEATLEEYMDAIDKYRKPRSSALPVLEKPPYRALRPDSGTFPPAPSRWAGWISPR